MTRGAIVYATVLFLCLTGVFGGIVYEILTYSRSSWGWDIAFCSLIVAVYATLVMLGIDMIQGAIEQKKKEDA